MMKNNHLIPIRLLSRLDLRQLDLEPNSVRFCRPKFTIKLGFSGPDKKQHMVYFCIKKLKNEDIKVRL
jgi:hypothetical protein